MSDTTEPSNVHNSVGIDAEDNAIVRQAAHNLPIVLPWGRQYVPLGTCYKSSLQSSKTESPWLDGETPFVLSDLHMMPTILSRERGTSATYRSVNTSRECETGDHLSLGLGVGVGIPFIASVSVKGTYDKNVVENKDSEKTSIHCSVTSAHVKLEQSPCLTEDAIVTIKNGGGYEAFCQRYGDYYLAGYRIGGETGMLLSSASSRTKETENTSVTVTVDVLLAEESKTWSNNFSALNSNKSLRLSGYDTLSGSTWDITTDGDGVDAVKFEAEAILNHSQRILDRVEDALDDLGLFDGQLLDGIQCDAMTKAGTVVELMLLPMSGIRDVSQWRFEGHAV